MRALEVDVLNDLRQRVERLERATSGRGFLNQKQAAAYMSRSDEWLRLEHAAGRGPKRHRLGTRGWRYAIADLDAYLLEGDSDAA
jgi:hypothetical protein